jgi:ubiquinone biosynthesis protein
MKRIRTTKIQSATEAGVTQWPKGVVVTSAEEVAAPAARRADIIRPMPRRTPGQGFGENVIIPRARRVSFKAGLFRTASRLLVWLAAIVRFYFGNLVDFVLLRNTIQRRASRLRNIFENTGPTLAKLGQQLSMRADLLPYAYCAELSKTLDRVPPMPTEKAIEIIERSLRRSLGEIFQAFDPDPVGSASLACVYQARLRTGERVAVKVRRPGVGPQVAADLRALDWLLVLAETLTVLAPGLSRRFRQETQSILFREMNFRTEARYTDLFRRRAAKRGNGVTAPKVYFDYCTEEVMVSEFVSGVWMWEILAAVDAKDEEALFKLRQQGIDPKLLARKLVLTWNREVQEELFFHADPHPANLVITANNGICFIDFGAIGRFSTQLRNTFRELQHHMIAGDIGRMVNSSLGLTGPIPPVDVEQLRWELEKIYADWVYAQKSKDAEWWERSTAQAWIRFMEVAQQFRLPVGFETIQYFRATFSYDSIIMRLDKDIDVVKQWEVYVREAAEAARHRVQARVRQRLHGPTDLDYLQVERLGDMATQFLFQLQRNVENPIVHFRNIVGKISYIASLLLRLGFWLVCMVGIALVVELISVRVFDARIDWPDIIKSAMAFGWIQFIIIVVVLVVIRRIVVRLNLPDSRLDPDRM